MKVERLGPLELRQDGRMVTMQNLLSPSEAEELRTRFREYGPELGVQIDLKSKALRDYLATVHPLKVMAAISMKHVVFDPEMYEEPLHEENEVYAEYALSLITSIPYPENLDELGEPNPSRIDQELQEIVGMVAVHDMTQLDPNDPMASTRLQTRGYAMFVRGNSYWEHEVDLLEQLFQADDAFFQNEVGTSAEHVLKFLCGIEVNLNGYFERLGQIAEVFRRVEEDEHSEISAEEKELFQKFEVQAPFEIKPKDASELAILAKLSLCLGDNSDFAADEWSPCWPTAKSKTKERPILRRGDRYYAFVPQLMIRNLPELLQGWMRDSNAKYFEKWKERAGLVLEDLSVKYLTKLLPGAQIYQSVYYDFPNRCEADGLLVYGDLLFIVECKAGALTEPAKRAAPARMKRDLGKLVGDALHQAKRLVGYLESAEEVGFCRADGTEVCRLRRKNFRKIFIVNPTLENLGHFVSQMGRMKEIGVVGDAEIWSVYINDLRVVSEILDSSAEFLLYLERRLGVNGTPFDGKDELELLGFFLSDRLYFEEEELKDVGAFIPQGYSVPIDRYYDFIAGRVTSGQKPEFNVNPFMKALATKILETDFQTRTEVSTLVLGLNGNSQDEIAARLPQMATLSKTDGKVHDLTMGLTDRSHGFTFVVVPERQDPPQRDWALIQMMHKRCARWTILYFTTDLELHPEYFPIAFTAPVQFGDEVQQAVEDFRRRKTERLSSSGVRVGRNESCPCGSGLKVKRCCKWLTTKQ